MQQREMQPIHRAGENFQRAPAGIASQPFWIETLAAATRDDLGAVIASMEPGTLTHWHSHPHGQILYVLSGVGAVQRHGSPIEALRAGDCIRFAPHERHWHGAAPATMFTYLSVQAARDGSAVTWFEPVTAGESR